MLERSSGRYNLHRLGWKAFEDLCVEVLREVLDATVSQFRVGGDAGRDAFFQGELPASLAQRFPAIQPRARKLVVQCKHASSPGQSLKMAIVAREENRVRALASSNEVDVYMIMSNRRLTAGDEQEIRIRFEQISGVQTCLVIGEEWLESIIDGRFRLLRRVPRLFGVGDLSQILSAAAAEKTQSLIQDMGHELRTFVPTPSYMKAIHALEQHGLVLLVGGPGCGKSSIALNMCVAWTAEDDDVEVIRVRDFYQLDDLISARDNEKIYWLEDIFGETRLDESMAADFARVFHNIKSAHGAGAKFIFTCRDYILRDAKGVLRSSKASFLENRAIIVEVADISPDEKERILYNHLKYGDLDRSVKFQMKALGLTAVARMPEFSPEIARRLGQKRFFGGPFYTLSEIQRFFRNPIAFFEEVINDLSDRDQATIAYVLSTGNRLPDPVPPPPQVLAEAYGVTAAEIRKSLDSMRGTLVKMFNMSGARYWQVHHPSMIDAMQIVLKAKSTMADVYLETVSRTSLLRDVGTKPEGHQFYVPQQLYSILARRIREFANDQPAEISKFITRQSKEFYAYLLEYERDLLCECVARGFSAGGPDWGLRMLDEFDYCATSEPDLLEIYRARATATVLDHGCVDLFLQDYLLEFVGSKLVGELTLAAMQDIGEVISLAYSRAVGIAVETIHVGRSDASSVHDAHDELLEFWGGMEFAIFNYTDSNEHLRLKTGLAYAIGPLVEKLEALAGIFDQLDRDDEDDEDWWEDRRTRASGTLDDLLGGMFSDVDE